MANKTYLNRYQVRHDASGNPIILRRSANSVTYHADDFSVQREASLELVSAAAIAPEMQEKLEAEAVAARTLNHINIPRLYDFGIENDQLVYASEYCDGTTAEAWVTEHGPMPAGAVLRIALQVVNALGAATFHGGVHHAINPKALLLVPGQTTEGEWPLIKVLNLIGIAPPAFTNVAGATAVFDSAAQFTSPEQLNSGTGDFRSGVYSLGRTLWFLLTGAVPMNETITRVSGVSKGMTQLVTSMISPDPAQRLHDPLALQERIRAALGSVERREDLSRRFGVPAPVATAPAITEETFAGEPRRRSVPIVPLALAAGILALAAVGAFFIPESLRPRSFFGAGQDSIGVPIGVPEPAAAAAANNNLAPVTQPAAIASQPTATAGPRVAAVNPPAPTPASEEPAAVSASPAEEMAVAAAPAPTAPPTLVSEPEPALPALASVEEEPAPSTSLAANNAAPAIEPTEPAPPAEGPSAVVARQAPAPAAETFVAQVARAAEPESEDAAPRVAAKPQPRITPDRAAEAAASSAKAEREKRARLAASAKKNERATDRPARIVANQPRRARPRGRVRAEYLGTTPEGELIFGMPSTNERVYAAPPTVLDPDERRPAQIRRALPPVLPALPPDDGDEVELDEDEE